MIAAEPHPDEIRARELMRKSRAAHKAGDRERASAYSLEAIHAAMLAVDAKRGRVEG